MRLKNMTEWGDRFLRRMVSWCCREVGLPVGKLRTALFSNTKKRCWVQRHGSVPDPVTGERTYEDRPMVDQKAYAGWGGSGGISVRVGDECRFPTKQFEKFGSTHYEFADRIEALVGVTAHEVYHCWQTANRSLVGRSRIDEPRAMRAERLALEKFRVNREALLAGWGKSESVKVQAPKPSIEDKRAAKAVNDLVRWQRKLKLAQTKCKKLKIRVAYYERRAACRSQEITS